MTTHDQEFHEEDVTSAQHAEQAEPEILTTTSDNATAHADRPAHKARPRRQTSRRQTDERAIIQLPQNDLNAEPPARAKEESDSSAMETLEAQGFTEDEALRLIHVSDRMKTSREAREAEAVLRRLRFTRWLIQQGMLDEFSA